MQNQNKMGGAEALCEMMEALTGDARFTALTASLLAKLYSQGRDEEAKSAVADRTVRARLYEELCIG